MEKKTVQSEGSVMYHVLSPLSILHRKISMEDVHRQRYFQGVYASSLNNYMPYVLGRKKTFRVKTVEHGERTRSPRHGMAFDF